MHIVVPAENQAVSRRSAAAGFAVTLVMLVWTGSALATTYYVSPAGSDSNSGTSTSVPWRSVARVNSATLVPGDAVRFAGGSSYPGLLQPRGSGSAGAAITFGAYGNGRPNLTGGISLASQSWLEFVGLGVDTGSWSTAGTTRGITTSSSGSGVTNVTVDDCAFANVAMGLLIQSRNDARWTVTDSTIQYTRDSGILIYDPNNANEIGGGPMTFARNRILDTGLDASLNWYKHGVYEIGHDIVWRDNVIRRFADGGISLRARGNTIEGNLIADGPYAIYFSPYDTTAGTTTIAYNRLSNVTESALEIAASAVSRNVESFVIANNTIAATANASGIRLLGTAGSVKIANNVVTVQNGPGFRSDTRPGGGLSSRANLWFQSGGSSLWGWLGGVYSSLSAFQASSGLGAGDVVGNPLLATDFSLGSGSPAVDRGVHDVDASLTYVGDCSGASYHYCGSGVDMGAVERGAAAPTPTGLAPPTNLAVTAAASTSITLTWSAGGDPRVTGYEVLRDGSLAATVSLPISTVSGLGCGTTSTFSVRAIGSAPTSSTTSIGGSTAGCAAASPGNSGAAPRGNGGGGGGGVPPEIALSLNYGPQPQTVGDQFDYAVSLVNNSIQGADQTVLTVNLPSDVELVGTRTTRGPGCSASGQALTCDLDFFPGKLADTVRITVRARAATSMTATASLWTLPADSDASNNTARLTLTVGAAAKPAASTIGSYTTAAATSATAAAAAAAQILPRTGTRVRPSFRVVAKSPKSVKAVEFSLDGRRTCVDRAAPFSCPMKARPGWHSVRVRPVGGKPTVVRLSVVG
jgi:hypothetical protein